MLLVAEPVLGSEECAAVVRVLEKGWVTQGEQVRLFEQAFAEMHGAEDAVGVNSCTAALHLLLASMGIGDGDEVLVPSLTFAATVNAVLYTGATPVLVEIESIDTPLMSVADAESKITPRTRAIVVMHYAGHMASAEEWRDLAERAGVLLFEDAAHAVGGPGAGTYGDGAAFSFYGNKNMTTAEGGMVLLREPEMLERARQMRAHGMTVGALQRLESRSAHYDVTMLGFNYRMDELRAAIGLVQLSRLAEFNRRRGELSRLYLSRLEPLITQGAGFVIPRPRSGRSAHHIFPVLVPPGIDRDRVAAIMSASGIQTTMHYTPVHCLTYHRERDPSVSLPLTEEFARRELTLPLHPKMRDEDVHRVVDELENALAPV